MIGKIQRVPLREVWKHEALDLTKWLQDNLDVLNEALGISFSNAEREQSAGDFNVDLVAEDENGSLVVIENQLEKAAMIDAMLRLEKALKPHIAKLQL